MAGSAKKHGVAGNKNGEKFKTTAERQKIFKLYCDHIAAGYTAKLFNGGCCENTVTKMIKDYPSEFDLEQLNLAHATGGLVWEQIGKLGIMGKMKGFNSSGWWRVMQNKLGWKDRMLHGNDPENPLPGSGGGALSKEEQAVLDHFKNKLLYTKKHQPSSSKGENNK